MTVSTQLISLIRQETSQTISPSIRALSKKILERHGKAAQAILLYGSCFRKKDAADGIVDLYLLVDNYRHAYHKHSYAFLNKLLSPNVFYLEIPYEGQIIRAKYAVFSLKDFQRGTSMRWFHSYLWCRLAQPVGIVYTSGNHITKQVYNATAQAVLTFITRVIPGMPPQFTIRELWCKGFRLTYKAELRAERQNKLVELFDADPHYYEKLTRAIMPLVPFSMERKNGAQGLYYQSKISVSTRISNRIAWNIRSFQGKVLSVLRLLKGVFTFENGLDYILWKMERHSGVTVRIDPRLRKIPLLGTGVLFWRLYKRGAFR